MEQKGQQKLNPIFSVSEYIEFLNLGLKKFGVAKITGEVTSIKMGPTGHVYFAIKEERYSVELPEEIIKRAGKALKAMLTYTHG